ncbi:cupin domain-containing protein [Roseococcus sp. SDR]|uniref:cupin domain-containing protein n=1 Tax=Roseococcus sp. SDR TaxID=2835532 RepID=UPI001BCF3FB4|nr:cupin domain-containing protein [Roseococcus sp. SDR]MBS7791218.1 cupin domain-containing protein [Roseococcus sp. SDR]MBV1846532.1 cupin domain-containing protein [Roseococcus sp. SDR]
MRAIVKRAAELRGFRIAPGDSNYFACLLDPLADGAAFTLVVEVFAPGGATPPNTHRAAQEAFFVLRGTGRARAGDTWQEIGPGDTLLLPPGIEHVVENPGPGKLYCLTLMVPDEDFAALIRAGIPVELDAEDIAVLTGR